MIKQSCLYLRGLTCGYSGSNVQNNQSWVDANMSEDQGTLTSFAVDGHASGYVCGFGSVFMNGAFVTPYSFDVDGNGGWLGSYKNSMVNDIVGALRQLRIMMDLGANYTHGRSTLIMSDEGSVTNQTDYNAWGQFINYLRTKRYDILPHMHNEIQAGAYGFDGQPHYFKQFSCVMLLLSSGSRTLSDTMINAMSQAIKEGVCFIVLQHSPGRGNQNFDAIFNRLGVYTNRGTYVSATTRAKNRAIEIYGAHISWQGVEQYHYKQAIRYAQGYWYNDNGNAKPGSLSGQGGVWHPIMCDTVDINDDIRASSPFYFREYCCVEPHSGFSADFDIDMVPYKPDSWRNDLDAGYHSISWSNNTAQSLEDRSAIFCRCVGYQVAIDSGLTYNGYTVINGQRWGEGRSYSVYKISKSTKQVVERRAYDVHGGGQGSATGIANAAAMAQFLNSIDGNFWVLVTMFDETAYNHMAGGLPEAMYRIGASRRVFGTDFPYRSAYNCFGSPGIGEGNAINEMLKGDISSDPNATFDVGYDFDSNGWPFTTGTNRDSLNQTWFRGFDDHNRIAHMSYSKNLDVVDLNKTFGIKNTVTYRDDRFRKLVMSETKQNVVSVENPCAAQSVVQSHDWVRVYAGAGAETVYYPFGNLKEYLVTSTDDSGPNELCTSHLMMNWEMFDGVGNNIAYNEAGPDHLLSCGGDRNNPASLFFGAGGARVFQVYERNYRLVEGEAGRDTNDWQVVWKWSGPGSQGHNIKIDPGYEYIMFAYDRYGSLELAERHFILPEASQLPKWGSGIYNADFSNSTLFTVDRNFYANAFCTKSSDHGTENGIMMIIRRPLFMSIGPEDRTGWQLVYNDQGTSVPKGSYYGITLESDYQYMVLCSTGNGGFSTHHFNGWNKTFETSGWDSDATIEAESCGRCQWSHDRRFLLTGTGALSTNAKEYLNGGLYAPIGVFQVYRRPILCWEPEDVNR